MPFLRNHEYRCIVSWSVAICVNTSSGCQRVWSTVTPLTLLVTYSRDNNLTLFHPIVWLSRPHVHNMIFTRSWCSVYNQHCRHNWAAAQQLQLHVRAFIIVHTLCTHADAGRDYVQSVVYWKSYPIIKRCRNMARRLDVINVNAIQPLLALLCLVNADPLYIKDCNSLFQLRRVTHCSTAFPILMKNASIIRQNTSECYNVTPIDRARS